MGLDMYLKATKHISGYSFYKEPEQKLYHAIIAAGFYIEYRASW